MSNPAASKLADFVRKHNFSGGHMPEILVSVDDYAALRPLLDANRMIRVESKGYYVVVDLGLAPGQISAPNAHLIPLIAE